jgi:tRNA nucleotidyltransferase (CCA-adding enzyme)
VRPPSQKVTQRKPKSRKKKCHRKIKKKKEERKRNPSHMNITLPNKVTQIIQRLEAAGFESYIVGGCVRDTLLNRTPDDWDITTSATPAQVKSLFPHTIDTGIKHGTVTVLISHEGYEVTTYRIDGEYKDNRHPDKVIFTPNLADDLKRRDFTINAMAYNDKTGLVDLFGGLADLNNHTIRCVGNAHERFNEDALRILRAVRFSAQLGFDIESDTQTAIKDLAPNLENISAERIQTELVKLLTSPHPDYIRDAYRLGITKVILPELDRAFATPQNNPHHMYNVGEHLMHAVINVRNDKSLRIAALLHDIGKPDTKTTDENGIDHFHGHVEKSEELAAKILKRLKFDNDTITKVRKYVKYHDLTVEPTQKALRRAVNKIGIDYFPQVLEIRRADTLAQSDYKRLEKLEKLDTLKALFDKILEQNQCVSLKDLAVTGNDLIAIGVPKGRRIGEILSNLLNDVIENPENNNREILLEKAKQML